MRTSSMVLVACLGARLALTAPQSGEPASPLVLVVHDSRTGNTERMARAVADGAASVEGVRVALRARGDVKDEEIIEASGIVLGSPVHWGSLSAESRSFLERVGDVLVGAGELGPGTSGRMRTAAAFVSAGAPSSGKELARLAILAAFLNMRFVAVGGEASDGFGTLGAQATTGESDPGVSELELAESRRFGARFAAVTLELVR